MYYLFYKIWFINLKGRHRKRKSQQRGRLRKTDLHPLVHFSNDYNSWDWAVLFQESEMPSGSPRHFNKMQDQMCRWGLSPGLLVWHVVILRVSFTYSGRTSPLPITPWLHHVFLYVQFYLPGLCCIGLFWWRLNSSSQVPRKDKGNVVQS